MNKLEEVKAKMVSWGIKGPRAAISTETEELQDARRKYAGEKRASFKDNPESPVLLEEKVTPIFVPTFLRNTNQ